jgi:hypothetical protein
MQLEAKHIKAKRIYSLNINLQVRRVIVRNSMISNKERSDSRILLSLRKKTSQNRCIITKMKT